jgi:transcriptional regulator with XRE-family HTH domain
MKVPPTVINRWLNGEHIPSLPALFKLIEALGMGIEDVLKDDVPPPAPSVDPSLLILLSRASPAQIRALKHLLEQMVLEETNHHLTKEVSRKKLLTKKR